MLKTSLLWAFTALCTLSLEGRSMIANRFNPLGVQMLRPYDYEVEYIRNVYTNWENGSFLVIDDYIPHLDDNFIMHLSPVAQSYNAVALFSVCDAWRTRAFSFYAANMWFGNKDKTVYSSVAISGISKIEVKNRQVYVNDVYGNDFSDATDSPVQPLALFALWTPTSSSSMRYFSRYDLKSIEVFRGGKQILDLRGVVDHNGVVCACNKVTGRLYYNQGTREFTAGPRI